MAGSGPTGPLPIDRAVTAEANLNSKVCTFILVHLIANTNLPAQEQWKALNLTTVGWDVMFR